jgi:hypothetical protein
VITAYQHPNKAILEVNFKIAFYVSRNASVDKRCTQSQHGLAHNSSTGGYYRNLMITGWWDQANRHKLRWAS